LVVVLDLAAQPQRCLGGVVLVELKFALYALALLDEREFALVHCRDEIVDLRERVHALLVVHRLIGIADQQRTLAAALFLHARQLLLFGAPLRLQLLALGARVAGRNDLAHGAGAAQTLLFTVQAIDDGPVRGDAPALGVGAAVDRLGAALG